MSSLVEAYLPGLRVLLAAVPPLVLGAVGVALTSGRLRTLSWLALIVGAFFVLGLLWRRWRLLRANAADFETASLIARELEQSARDLTSAPNEPARAGADETGDDEALGVLHTLPDLILLDLDPRITAQMGTGVDAWLSSVAGRELAVARRSGPLGYGTTVGLFSPAASGAAGASALVRVVIPPGWWPSGYVSGAAAELGAPLVPGSHSYAGFVNQSRALIAETRCAGFDVSNRLREMVALPREQRRPVTVRGAWIGPGALLAGSVSFGPPGSEVLSVFPFALLVSMAETAARHQAVFREVSFYGVAKSQLRVLRRRKERRGA